MALLKKTPTTTKPAEGTTLKGGAAPAAGAAAGATFEEPDGAAAAAAAEAPAATTTAVAVKPVNAVGVQKSIQLMDVIEKRKNAYKVDWNTLDRIQANQGQFLDMDGKKPMGTVIQMQLLSWQDSYQVSPGVDGEEAKKHVRYSDDGVMTNQGENIAEYVEMLRSLGFVKAKCSHRCTLVGVLAATEKDEYTRLVGNLVQIDLSATSRQEFDKHRMNTAFKIGQGLLTPDAAELMTMTATPASFGGKDWTKVVFEPTILPA